MASSLSEKVLSLLFGCHGNAPDTQAGGAQSFTIIETNAVPPSQLHRRRVQRNRQCILQISQADAVSSWLALMIFAMVIYIWILSLNLK
jgi:hypothetical protein